MVVATGTIAYRLLEDWSWVDALYFTTDSEVAAWSGQSGLLSLMRVNTQMLAVVSAGSYPVAAAYKRGSNLMLVTPDPAHEGCNVFEK